MTKIGATARIINTETSTLCCMESIGTVDETIATTPSTRMVTKRLLSMRRGSGRTEVASKLRGTQIAAAAFNPAESAAHRSKALSAVWSAFGVPQMSTKSWVVTLPLTPTNDLTMLATSPRYCGKCWIGAVKAADEMSCIPQYETHAEATSVYAGGRKAGSSSHEVANAYMKSCEAVSTAPPTAMENDDPYRRVTMPHTKLHTPKAYGRVLMFMSSCCDSSKCCLRAGE
mmetsp:Transcript_1003/g.2775  ORF Transcript_1003/g.2775 Transcript_1003/m.2775 type:complete len:229 (+) Transcript_1003:1250-1936(+)